jgi:tRNA(fMet)-specific endonuclease VapC
MLYILDTNIIVHLIRASPLAEQLKTEYLIFDQPQRPLISVVTEGELEALALKNDWGKNKYKELYSYLEEFLNVDIRIKSIIRRYAEIDAFSQGKLKNRRIVGSARNMGKNDLWIAATASVLDATLLTTDKDFDHLNNVFLNVVFLDPKLS